MKQHQRITASPRPAALPSSLPHPHLRGPLVQQEVLGLLVGELDEAVEEGRDLEGGGVVVDGCDFGSGAAVVVLNSERRKKVNGRERSCWV